MQCALCGWFPLLQAAKAFREVRENGKRMAGHWRIFKLFTVISIRHRFAGPLGDRSLPLEGASKVPVPVPVSSLI